MLSLKFICVIASAFLICSIFTEGAAVNRVSRSNDDFNIPLPFGNINVGKGPDGKRKVGISNGINIDGHGLALVLILVVMECRLLPPINSVQIYRFFYNLIILHLSCKYSATGDDYSDVVISNEDETRSRLIMVEGNMYFHAGKDKKHLI
uniref:Uncharacterized protein n=1 Tax=Ditylenchus dipsaci TaxID=166011 RepID=A0A915DD49_9BILA